MREMNSLTLNGKKYDTFVDDKAREMIGRRSNLTSVSEIVGVARSYHKARYQADGVTPTFLYDTANTPLTGKYDPGSEEFAGAIDCSTYVGLILRGIPFEKSPYAHLLPGAQTGDDDAADADTGADNNNGDDNATDTDASGAGAKFDPASLVANVADFSWAINPFEWKLPQVFGGDPKPVRTAAQLAQWMYERGMAVPLDETFSNLMPGDIVFWAKKKSNGDWVQPNRYKHISHVAICCGRYDAPKDDPDWKNWPAKYPYRHTTLEVTTISPYVLNRTLEVRSPGSVVMICRPDLCSSGDYKGNLSSNFGVTDISGWYRPGLYYLTSDVVGGLPDGVESGKYCTLRVEVSRTRQGSVRTITHTLINAKTNVATYINTQYCYNRLPGKDNWTGWRSEGSGSGSGGSQNGNDGFSPIATVEQTASGAVITITDKGGTTTATVTNGKDGVDGQDGKDGYTPVKGKDYFDGQPGKDGSNGADGYTPVKGVDYHDGQDGKDGKDGLDATPVAPLFANSVAECTDTSKFYVLPDGFIYAYRYVEATGPSYTNLAGTITYDKRLSSSGKVSSSAMAGACYTGFIPVKQGQIVRVKNLDMYTDFSSSAYPYVCFYTGASESNVVSATPYVRPHDLSSEFSGIANSVSGSVVTWTAFKIQGGAQHSLASSITHIRISGKYFSDKEIIVTVDEEITEGGSAGGYTWVNTGHAFVPADYEAEILSLQKNKADKTAIPTKLPNPNALTIDGVKYDGSAAVNIETQSGGNILYGKKWVACGDSFTAGGYNPSDGFDESVYVYQDGRFAGRQKVYPNIIGLRNNMDIVNLATGGQTMAASSNSFMTRYANIDADADYITIMLGINDKIQGIPVGTLEDAVNTTFCGAFNIAMEHILENHPLAHIGIMVSHGTNEEIMEATRGIAQRWGVPYLDYGSPQVPLMNRYTGRNVCAKAQQIREKNFCVISDGITPTNGHPNTAAHEYESTFIEAWLRTL